MRQSTFLSATSWTGGQLGNFSPTVPDLNAALVSTRLDIQHLEADVQRNFEAGLAASTMKTYKAGMSKFFQFCQLYSIAHPFQHHSLLCVHS